MLSIRKINLLVLAGTLLIAMILPSLASSPAMVPIGTPTIRRIALGPGLRSGTTSLALIVEDSSGASRLLFKKDATLAPFDDLGIWVAADVSLAGVIGVGVEVDLTLVGLELPVSQFKIAFDPDGSVHITGPTTQGPFGDPAVHGRPTSLAVLPQPSDPTGPWIVIGTDAANVILAKSGIEPCYIPVGGPVVDVAVVPQVGYFAVLALVNRRDGQHLVGIRPPNATSDSPIVVFDLTPATATAILAFDTHGFIDPAENADFFEPAPINLLAANGTQFIHRLTIPAEPTIGGTFQVQELKAADSLITQVAIGRSSLAMLSVDGAGVLYDPGFRVDRGGVSGKLMTIFGSSLEVRPSRLSLQDRQRFVTAFIEVANNNAAQIDRSSIGVRIGGAELPNSAIHAQLQPADFDHDGILDLEVKLDRAAVQTLIPAGATSVIIKTNWRFTDGSTGFASAEIRIKPDGDDE